MRAPAAPQQRHLRGLPEPVLGPWHPVRLTECQQEQPHHFGFLLVLENGKTSWRPDLSRKGVGATPDPCTDQKVTDPVGSR